MDGVEWIHMAQNRDYIEHNNVTVFRMKCGK